MSISKIQNTASSASTQVNKKRDCCEDLCDKLFGSCKKEPSQPVEKKRKVELGPVYSVKSLVEEYRSKWNGKAFHGIEFNEERFNQTVKKNNEQFPLCYDEKKDYGYVIKREVEADSEIYVRADLHGDLKVVLEDLKVLQERGFLNSQYQCTGGVQLVFLGDYVDRGPHSMQVLELLMKLRMENPEQVTLIHGNHEDTMLNQAFAADHDPHFKSYMKDENLPVLKSFYDTLPLTLYLGHKKGFVQFTHGLFELHFDPKPMLQSDKSSDSMPVPRLRMLSERVRKMNTPSSKRIMDLWMCDVLRKGDFEFTTFNWGDIGSETKIGLPGSRDWMLSPQDVKHYQEVMGIGFLIRGHQHVKEEHVAVTTLPVAMLTTPYHGHIEQEDNAYLIKVGSTVAEWTKQAIVRNSGQLDGQSTITKAYPLSAVIVSATF